MSRFPWLKENKHRAQMEKGGENPMPYSLHAGYNRDIIYTGNGNPNQVAMNTPSGPVHKGELMFGGNGKVVTDAMSSKELMSNPVISGNVGYGCGGYKKGYQTGGYLREDEKFIAKKQETGMPPRNDEKFIAMKPPKTETGIPVTSQGPNITPPSDTPAKKTVTPEYTSEMLRRKGLGGIENVMKTGGVAGRIGGKEISDLKSTQDVERQVAKQELAQKGVSEDVAAGRMARLTGEQEGQLADVETKTAIEGAQARERAAQVMAAEGTTQASIEIQQAAQSLNEEQFEEFVRQFDVGSSQWDTAFSERRRQFDVGSDQWDQSFQEQRDQYQKNFEEKIRQFDVGSAQWEKAHKDRNEYQWATFNEQKHQFEVGSDQWEKAHNAQLDQWEKSFSEQRRQFDVGSDQWEKSFKEERRRYDIGTEQWNKSFNEQRRQFDVGSDQWNKSFGEQKRQFDVGSDQWNKVHDLQVKEFGRKLDLDKHNVDVWKDNVAHRDKAYLDNLTMDKQKLEMQRAAHEANMKIVDMKVDATKTDLESKKYWESSEKFSNYALTHIDGYNKGTGEFSWDAKQQLFGWFKSKYSGTVIDKYNDPSDLESKDPEMYKAFMQWSKEEWTAATDNRLINPYDKILHDIKSSEEMDEASKKVAMDILNNPEALASIAGIEYNPDTKTVSIKSTGGTKTTTSGTKNKWEDEGSGKKP